MSASSTTDASKMTRVLWCSVHKPCCTYRPTGLEEHASFKLQK